MSFHDLRQEIKGTGGTKLTDEVRLRMGSFSPLKSAW
jgi:hypothetical protein